MNHQTLEKRNASAQASNSSDASAISKKNVNAYDATTTSSHNFGEIPIFPPVQPKLAISQPNDMHEQEADAVADKVMKEETAKPQSPNIPFASSSSVLPLSTRHFMQNRFGADFSAVRIHTDSNAAEMNKSIQAKAFTYGNDIYFNQGYFKPGSKDGDTLLAHELTHVVQQAPVKAQNVNVTARPGNVVQRSILGGILGGLGGAVGGAVLGGLIGGPIGAVIGGVAGLIGGALIGDSATTKSRSLTSEEIKYAKEVFKDSIDYSQIKITRDSLMAAGAPRTIGNTINLKSDWGHFKGDTLELTDTGKETLIHEMGHVWQYQNGGLAYIPDSLIAQLKAKLSGKSRNAAYDWRAADKAKIPWEKWNPEQQAEAIEDYNKLLRKSKAGTATVAELAELATLQTYMAKVWAREGAPTYEPMDLSAAPF